METMESLITKAKRAVERQRLARCGEAPTRRWLEATPDHSYRDERYRVTIYVLEGSPPRGYVIASWGANRVKAYAGDFRKRLPFGQENCEY
jgi:hypothetical protein